MTTISLADYRRDEQASLARHDLYRAANANGEWLRCEVRSESTSRLRAIAALALAAIRPATKETAK